jgi:phosphoribosylformimino-5-aminoimidazole carboxamide ribotide isomerase
MLPEVLPVLDLKNHCVVRGVAGDRENYRPIESRLCDGAAPGVVARGLRETFGFSRCYIADLDAIAGGEPAWACYDDVIAAGFSPWIDAGIRSADQGRRIADYLAARSSEGRVIVGLESMPDVLTLAATGRAVRWERLVFSLDLNHGEPFAPSYGWAGQTPEQIAEQAVAVGVQTLIVLDLAAVGVGQGVPTLELCRTLHAKYPTLQLVTGGGVRDVADLRAIAECGCHAALVASALHDGRLTRELLTATGV